MASFSVVLLFLSTVFVLTGGFIVTSTPHRLQRYNETAILVYNVNPWPPPYKVNASAYDVVTAIHYKVEEGGGKIQLCQLVFHKGQLQEQGPLCVYSRLATYLGDQRRADLLIHNVAYRDMGRYELNLTYDGGDQSVAAHVDLEVWDSPPTPVVSRQPKGDLDVGDDVTFHCNVSGVSPPADVRWERDKSLLPGQIYKKAKDWQDESTADFTLEKVTANEHGAAFVCLAENRANGQSHENSETMSLQVRHAPRVQLQPCVQRGYKYKIREHRDAIFTCSFSAYPKVTRVEWYRENQRLSLPVSPNMTQLTVKGITRANQSLTYHCKAQNEKGAVNNSCELDVLYGPRVHLPGKMEIPEGQELNLTCTTDSNPEPHEYSWTKFGDATFEQPGQFLTFEKADPDDAGRYRCTARNEMKEAGNRPPEQGHGVGDVQIHVIYTPRLQAFALTKFTGRMGQKGSVHCHVRGYPNVTVTMTRKGSTVGAITSKEDDKYTISHEIQSVTENDIGDYICTASNSLGQKEIKVQLLKPGIPDPPMWCIKKDVTHLEATLECSPGYDGGETVTYSAEKKGQRSGQASCQTTYEQDGIAVLKVGDLWPYTNFTLLIYGNNKHGRSQSYYSIDLQTLHGAAPPSPRGPDVGAILGGVFAVALITLLVLLAVLYIRKNGRPTVGKIKESKTMQAILNKRAEAKMAHQILKHSALERAARLAAKEEEEGEKMIPAVAPDCNSLDPLTKKVAEKNKVYGHPSFQSAVPNEYVHVHKGKIASQRPLSAAYGNAYDNRAYANDVTNDKRGLSLIGQGAMGHSALGLLNAGPQTVPLETPGVSGARVEERGAYGGAYGGEAPVQKRSTSSYGDEWEFPRERLELREKIGEGCFGEVWEAVARGIAGRSGNTFVAVKTLKERSPLEERRSLLKELDTMKLLAPHPNVIQLYGCCTDDDPVFILMEYASEGNLQDFLRRNRTSGGATYGRAQFPSKSLTSHDLTVFALQVASGMEYISSNELLHRDLAARNVLVNHKMVCKISDFGFARDVIHSRQYESKTQRRLPIRWMAPESLYDGIYRVSSDVWSFGVLLWEVVTLGSSPYPGMSGPDVMDAVQAGYRMEKPRHCSDSLYYIMLECWQHEPSKRPPFSAIRMRLEDILCESDTTLEVAQLAENMYEILHNMPGEKC